MSKSFDVNITDQFFPQTPQEEPQPEPEVNDTKKRVFSIRATQQDISCWKAYAVATKQTTGALITAAVTEYMENHALTDEQQAIFDYFVK